MGYFIKSNRGIDKAQDRKMHSQTKKKVLFDPPDFDQKRIDLLIARNQIQTELQKMVCYQMRRTFLSKNVYSNNIKTQLRAKIKRIYLSVS